jgi:tetratricopeptide (TPR) repeat protein
MDATFATGAEFVEGMRPYLADGDTAGLVRYLEERWPRATLVSMLNNPDISVVKASIVCLQLQGGMSDTPALARLLHHPDIEVVSLAENALWSIWLRAGNREAGSLLARAIEAMNEKAFRRATNLLDRAIRLQPGFAEAYNQRAFAWYLSEKYLRSVADCRRALALNPWHFGAAAGLGHCFAHLGLYERALDAYHAALKLHPRMEGVRTAIRQIRGILNDANARSRWYE